MPPIIAAEGAAVAAAAASGAFKYNRMNYMFDAGLRWGRFTTGYSMAMAQAAMYREDIRDMTTLTATKQDSYHTLGTIFFVLNFQLIMAGRLGVHGPSPPGWLLGLYWTNICTALMFLVTFTWMAMHASARATAGGAYMLTRHVRLPIPTPKMLDKARVTGNTYEKQRVADVFRIPFAMPAGRESEQEDAEHGGMRVPISERRMPKWYHDEVKDLRKDEGGSLAATTNPEHFELYRGLQEEWWAYDVYSRIGILFFMSHWLTSASLYSICHIFTELRCLWPAWTVVPCFVTAHYSVLSLDIVNKPREGGTLSIPVEKIVPFVPFVATLGMSIDYSVLEPSVGWQSFIYLLSWICYITQFFWAIRLYDLAAPQVQRQDMPEQPGKPWWPAEWPLPPAFEDALYLVAAPKNLEPGQTCLQTEMKAGKGKKGLTAPVKKQRETNSTMFPWKLFRGACITSISMWVLIMVGRGFEQVNGERYLLRQEGRVERWPSHFQPWMPPWTRKGSRNEWCHAGGCDRRLTGEEVDEHRAIQGQARDLSAALGPLAQALLSTATTTPTPAGAALRNTEIKWSMGFSPKFLVANGAGVVALTSRGQGSMVRISGGEADAAPVFSLDGLADLGDIVGASSADQGLTVVTTTGAIAECAGAAPAGAWACQRVAVPSLPTGLQAAVAGRHPETNRVLAAVAAEGEKSILLLEADEESRTWLPSGEIRAPSAKLTLSLQGLDLLVASADGAVHVRSLVGSAAHHGVEPQSHHIGKSWHGACSLGNGRLAHLASPFTHAGRPELFVSAATAAA